MKHDMDIEISPYDNNRPRDTSYARLYNNGNDRAVDVIIREALQNSLDAGMHVSDKASERSFVQVDFSSGKFLAKSFSSHLNGISGQLNTKFPADTYTYLSIRDTYTSG
ncbi:MAG: hypothetical protein K2K97_05055, partial [Muribaculaceae bacterium]|nr:hypothetical protein [Muribaculaceae bacterium]